ncbi:MAG: FAD-binding protein [Lachnospiraceae bacterium]|nr:FAD-binding protein [Lachnospiraceae bacterium]
MKYQCHEINTLVVGTGCAGYNAADWLYDLKVPVMIVTEGRKMGTSRNTGSDKQTYYKIALTADNKDSIGEMTDTLADGIGVHGDLALIEAANSLKCFYKLVNLGVPFPTNEYGEYVGYKTDHDPKQRATSAGPLTSKYMTECLEESVKRKKISVLDHITIIKIITKDGKVAGALGVDKGNEFHLFSCQNLILATGGPAAVYKDSVYPASQSGMTGIALEAGARADNLQEWQYGLASVKFRWNVSSIERLASERGMTKQAASFKAIQK